MKSNYKALNELVERVDIRNSDGGIDELIGVSIEKCFIKSVANTIGTDLTKYRIIKKNEFAVSLMQVSRDAKIPIACLKDYEIAIMSPAYSIFRVKNEQEVLPEYLDLWFRRSEFDREAAFIAVGGVRGSMPWDEFTRMEVFIPDYEEQLCIVNNYKAISDRIALKRQINDNLAEYLNCVFVELSQKAGEAVPLSSICQYVTDKASFSDLKKLVYISTENILPDKQGVSSFGTTSSTERVVHFQKEDVLVSNIRPYFKKMWFATTEGGCNADVLCFRALDNRHSYLLKSVLYQDGFFDYVMSGAKGTKMPRGDKGHIIKYPIPQFSEVTMQQFNNLAVSVEEKQAQNRKEIALLTASLDIVLSTLSR